MKTLTQPNSAPLTAAAATSLILAGKAPAGMQVGERLDLSNHKKALRLPPGLKVATLKLSGCTGLTELPEGLQVRHLHLNGCTALTRLPPGLHCYELYL